MQVVLVKYSLCLIRYIVIRDSEILQIYFHVTQELVVFGKYRNDRDLTLMC